MPREDLLGVLVHIMHLLEMCMCRSQSMLALYLYQVNQIITNRPQEMPP